jgi:hypothetical protein
MMLNTCNEREASLKNLAFGCGFRVSSSSVSGVSFNGAYGVIGLGRGPISFLSQLGHRFGNKSSYCLMDYTISPPPTSFLMIRHNVVPRISRISYTPLHSNLLSPTFYYIGIQSVSVNGVKLQINPIVWSVDKLGYGGTIIDSGTTLTFLAELAYRQVLLAFKQRVRRLPSVAKPTLGFDLCVNVSGVSRPNLPSLRFRLVGNSVFSLPSKNYFRAIFKNL